ncbi:DNA internalization-related competence protein ComEC/Rec2 [Piscinibacter sp.]|uniref:DNA internalization-related competence protein ComEC/Rec2 n=1 Tax=Piscinibacter sp. TaxID=1903157 RepID=UPI002C768244|nr:DNA internalization-related competence protein ComEC/Rec2 [Albitalea sp.]HUG23895.1 DNA internalization-related competence protein ComEC/Rec2 [Albitalea sp.]
MGGHHTGWRLAALALAWLGGVAVQLNERTLIAPAAYAVAVLAGALCVAVAWRWRAAFVLGLAGIAAVGFGSAGWRATERLAQSLPAALEGQDIDVVGLVADLPQTGPTGLRFRFEVEQATRGGEAVTLPPLLALGWYAGFGGDGKLTPQQRELRAGQRWRFTVRLRQPHGNMNPHGFDYELYLFERGIRATGYVRDDPPQLLDRAAGHVVERWRQRMRDAIDAAVPDPRAAGMLAALSIGDQSAIEREDWELFRITGIAHLVSISGLHVTMFAWLAGVLIAAAWRRSLWAMSRVPAQQAARWGGFACALAYAVLSGWGVPSQRTVWMLATVTLLQTLGRRWPWPLILLAAAVVVTAVDPWALLQPGFWLSFVAVGLLMASDGESGRDGEPTPVGQAWRGRAFAAWLRLRAELRGQVVATLGLAPLTLVFFQQISVVGFLANLVAIPVVTLVITPLALLGSLWSPLWALGAWAVRQLCAWLGWLAAMPAAIWTAPAALAWAQLAGLAAAVLLVLPLPWRLRLLAVPLALPLLMPALRLPPAGEFELLAVDVGQGTAVLVRTRSRLLVYDTGPQYSRDSDAGRRVLLPLLQGRGEGRIDVLMLSHRDGDHVGGAKSLIEAVHVDELWSSLEDGHPLLPLVPNRTRCTAGQAWQWDGVRFEVLHPPGPAYGRARKPNAISCVVRVSSPATGSVLLAGDIERAQEAWLVAHAADALRSDVLLVPHHGSKTSSSDAFLDAVQPRVAVYQAGYRNRFGHPAPEVMARYRRRGADGVESASCGAWRWQGGPAQPGVCQRDAARRYWHHVSQPAGACAQRPAENFRGLNFATLRPEETCR